MMNKMIAVYTVIFGLQTIKLKNKMVSGLIFCYNCLLPCVHVSTSIICATAYELQANFPQNPVTISSFWCQYYARVIISCYMTASIFNEKEEISRVYGELGALEEICSNYGKPPVIYKQMNYVVLLALSVSAPAIIVADLFLSPSNRNFTTIWSSYIPGCVIIIYMVYFSYMQRWIGAIFKVVNDLLSHFTERLSIEDVVNEGLLGFPHKFKLDDEILHEMFVLHNRTYELALRLNKIYSNAYVYYSMLTLHGSMLLTYSVMLDFIRVRAGRGLQPREHIFTEYWSVMYLVALFGVVFITHELNENCNATLSILKKIERIYGHVSVYLYQLTTTELQTSVAGYFQLDYPTLMIIAGLSVKYCFILMQFDVGDWSSQYELKSLMNAQNITQNA